MMIRTALTDKARAELIGWLNTVLKPKYCAELFADNFDVNLGVQGQSAEVIFEVRPFHTKSKNPETYSFFGDDNFMAEEIEG